MSSMSQFLGLRPEYRWSRPGRFGRPFHSELHTNGVIPDGQIYWQGTEICWLGTKPLSEDAEFLRSLRMRVRRELAARQPAALRTMTVVTEPTSAEILDGLQDWHDGPDTTHLDSALLRARAY